MKLYLASLGADMLVGVVYSLINVRSPAPPVVALVGLLGILVGEQVVPVARHLIAGRGLREAVGLADCHNHVLGELPANRVEAPAASDPAASH
ncbi:XapX domain-containing protein [Xanthobacteraceae bacterium Astr-EGSB]|uniref:XapX domain-containing protein n=1 Tax=Astrobacterium formosum TaxID=3069710 RepID=UPI0027B618E0|nr:XapX domain-containing protein [Xanthobacteraceae bacterium Astr-EGSB]